MLQVESCLWHDGVGARSAAGASAATARRKAASAGRPAVLLRVTRVLAAAAPDSAAPGHGCSSPRGGLARAAPPVLQPAEGRRPAAVETAAGAGGLLLALSAPSAPLPGSAAGSSARAQRPRAAPEGHGGAQALMETVSMRGSSSGSSDIEGDGGGDGGAARRRPHQHQQLHKGREQPVLLPLLHGALRRGPVAAAAGLDAADRATAAAGAALQCAFDDGLCHVTVISFASGAVLFQNARSKALYGDLTVLQLWQQQKQKQHGTDGAAASAGQVLLQLLLSGATAEGGDGSVHGDPADSSDCASSAESEGAGDDGGDSGRLARKAVAQVLQQLGAGQTYNGVTQLAPPVFDLAGTLAAASAAAAALAMAGSLHGPAQGPAPAAARSPASAIGLAAAYSSDAGGGGAGLGGLLGPVHPLASPLDSLLTTQIAGGDSAATARALRTAAFSTATRHTRGSAPGGGDSTATNAALFTMDLLFGSAAGGGGGGGGGGRASGRHTSRSNGPDEVDRMLLAALASEGPGASNTPRAGGRGAGPTPRVPSAADTRRQPQPQPNLYPAGSLRLGNASVGLGAAFGTAAAAAAGAGTAADAATQQSAGATEAGADGGCGARTGAAAAPSAELSAPEPLLTSLPLLPGPGDLEMASSVPLLSRPSHGQQLLLSRLLRGNSRKAVSDRLTSVGAVEGGAVTGAAMGMASSKDGSMAGANPMASRSGCSGSTNLSSGGARLVAGEGHALVAAATLPDGPVSRQQQGPVASGGATAWHAGKGAPGTVPSPFTACDGTAAVYPADDSGGRHSGVVRNEPWPGALRAKQRVEEVLDVKSLVASAATTSSTSHGGDGGGGRGGSGPPEGRRRLLAAPELLALSYASGGSAGGGVGGGGGGGDGGSSEAVSAALVVLRPMDSSAAQLNSASGATGEPYADRMLVPDFACIPTGGAPAAAALAVAAADAGGGAGEVAYAAGAATGAGEAAGCGGSSSHLTGVCVPTRSSSTVYSSRASSRLWHFSGRLTGGSSVMVAAAVAVAAADTTGGGNGTGSSTGGTGCAWAGPAPVSLASFASGLPPPQDFGMAPTPSSALQKLLFGGAGPAAAAAAAAAGRTRMPVRRTVSSVAVLRQGSLQRSGGMVGPPSAVAAEEAMQRVATTTAADEEGLLLSACGSSSCAGGSDMAAPAPSTSDPDAGFEAAPPAALAPEGAAAAAEVTPMPHQQLQPLLVHSSRPSSAPAAGWPPALLRCSLPPALATIEDASMDLADVQQELLLARSATASNSRESAGRSSSHTRSSQGRNDDCGRDAVAARASDSGSGVCGLGAGGRGCGGKGSNGEETAEGGAIAQGPSSGSSKGALEPARPQEEGGVHGEGRGSGGLGSSSLQELPHAALFPAGFGSDLAAGLPNDDGGVVAVAGLRNDDGEVVAAAVQEGLLADAGGGGAAPATPGGVVAAGNASAVCEAGQGSRASGWGTPMHTTGIAGHMGVSVGASTNAGAGANGSSSGIPDSLLSGFSQAVAAVVKGASMATSSRSGGQARPRDPATGASSVDRDASASGCPSGGGSKGSSNTVGAAAPASAWAKLCWRQSSSHLQQDEGASCEDADMFTMAALAMPAGTGAAADGRASRQSGSTGMLDSGCGGGGDGGGGGGGCGSGNGGFSSLVFGGVAASSTTIAPALDLFLPLPHRTDGQQQQEQQQQEEEPPLLHQAQSVQRPQPTLAAAPPMDSRSAAEVEREDMGAREGLVVGVSSSTALGSNPPPSGALARDDSVGHPLSATAAGAPSGVRSFRSFSSSAQAARDWYEHLNMGPPVKPLTEGAISPSPHAAPGSRSTGRGTGAVTVAAAGSAAAAMPPPNDANSSQRSRRRRLPQRSDTSTRLQQLLTSFSELQQQQQQAAHLPPSPEPRTGTLTMSRAFSRVSNNSSAMMTQLPLDAAGGGLATPADNPSAPRSGGGMASAGRDATGSVGYVHSTHAPRSLRRPSVLLLRPRSNTSAQFSALPIAAAAVTPRGIAPGRAGATSPQLQFDLGASSPPPSRGFDGLGGAGSPQRKADNALPEEEATVPGVPTAGANAAAAGVAAVLGPAAVPATTTAADSRGALLGFAAYCSTGGSGSSAGNGAGGGPNSAAVPLSQHYRESREGRSSVPVLGATMTIAAAAPAGPAATGPEGFKADSGFGTEGGGGDEGELVLVVTQIDVTEQVEAHEPLLQLLQQEHKVLESIFPRHILEYLTLRGGDTAQAPQLCGGGGGGVGGGLGLVAGAMARDGLERLASLATSHTCVTILFTDIVGFTDMCSAATPYEVMCFLNSLYSRFDGLVDIYKVYKVETIGDCYMVAGGLVAYDQDGYKSVIAGEEDPLHAVRVMEFAKAMLRAAREVRMPHNGEPVRLRVGLHSGPVTSGVVGDRMPRFCLFGDTVNVASRMESTCRPGRIHVSAATQARLPNEPWRDLGMTAVKGKGEMRTFEWGGDADEHLDGQQLQRVLGLYL
ncbi:hypothetical protein HYH02_007079 [Chlamydomonas schloesseri]|uniref:Guanylate cyclase domain-containing protein n=1 Tax=Chlamydomonas schloesseri TaxID=2026947 RepID=A0A835WIL4_9CHLO|nr:hypothetical protein HYH02_007079 [Chlamydomonas schloesseri]|eukprot:KAG2448052.1 hypothetical protein HYH02_007079 [Chlamydomonas schloesseri]